MTVADAGKSPLAAAVVRRIDPIFAIERENNGLSAEQRALPRLKRGLRRSFICDAGAERISPSGETTQYTGRCGS